MIKKIKTTILLYCFTSFIISLFVNIFYVGTLLNLSYSEIYLSVIVCLVYFSIVLPAVYIFQKPLRKPLVGFLSCVEKNIEPDDEMQKKALENLLKFPPLWFITFISVWSFYALIVGIWYYTRLSFGYEKVFYIMMGGVTSGLVSALLFFYTLKPALQKLLIYFKPEVVRNVKPHGIYRLKVLIKFINSFSFLILMALLFLSFMNYNQSIKFIQGQAEGLGHVILDEISQSMVPRIMNLLGKGKSYTNEDIAAFVRGRVIGEQHQGFLLLFDKNGNELAKNLDKVKLSESKIKEIISGSKGSFFDETGNNLVIYSPSEIAGFSLAIVFKSQALFGATESLKRFSGIFAVAVTIITVFLAFLVASDISKPLIPMNAFAKRVAEGNISGNIGYTSEDEIGELAISLEVMAEELKKVITGIRESSNHIVKERESVNENAKNMLNDAQTQMVSVDETSASMEEITTAIKRIAENTAILETYSQESSSSILEMEANIEEVTTQTETLALSVEDTSSSIAEIAAVTKEVADNAGILSEEAGSTSASILQLKASISQIERNSEISLQLSNMVTEDSSKGIEASENSKAGMKNILNAAFKVEKSINYLNERIEDINKILKVIDDITRQTNLLALNAAIIASQAGEHGKSFAVVAGEIKELADKTASSTKEIAALIKSINEASDEAVKVMNENSSFTRTGFELNKVVESSLKKVQESAEQSKLMIEQIVTATKEQANATFAVGESSSRVSEMSQQIFKATREQNKGIEQIIGASEKMRDISIMVKRSMVEQSKGAKQISKAVNDLTSLVSQINNAIKEQSKGTERVLLNVEKIKDIGNNSVRNIRSVSKGIESFSNTIDKLKGEVTRFKVV